MSLRAIEKMLKNMIGLNAESVGTTTIERVIRLRMETCGSDDVDEYHRRVLLDGVELQALIDEVTVPETWFFRDREPFQLLAEQAIRWRDAVEREGRVLRMLSVPCATGEEPYSIAMVMEDLGLSRDQVRIDAMDISTRALERARKGVYRNNSFRGDEGDRRARYFHQSEGEYELDPSIRERVKFRHGNLLDADSLRGEERYDIIFCRNLLIYFDRPLQGRAVEKLHSLLRDDGVLFVGHAEAGRLFEGHFKSIKRPGTFAFRKQIPDGDAPGAVTQPSGAVPDGRASAPMPAPARPARGPRPVVRAQALAVHGDIFAVTELDQAQRCADQGQLHQAARLCMEYVARHPAATEAYYLLGVIREAEGDYGLAEELFRKAVYLEPAHYHALVHLAARAELRGDRTQAEALRTRAKRAVQGRKLGER